MTYIDYEKLSYAVLRNVLHTNANIHQRMKIIEAELSKKKIIRGGDLSGSALPSGNAAASGAPNPPVKAQNTPLPPPPSNWRIPGWVWFLVISFVFKFVLNASDD